MHAEPVSPQVSVVMSMRNSAATIEDAVRSIIFQTLRDWELIVVDDGSSDASAALVEAFGDPRIRVLRQKESAGLAARLNLAIADARAPFIARMDADDIAFPQRLARQLAYLAAHPEIDVVACDAVVFDDAKAAVAVLHAAAGAAITARPHYGFSLPHPTWCGRTAWFRANAYDPAQKKAEDQDLMLRTFEASRFASIPEVLFGYRQHRLDLKKLLGGRFYYARSLLRYGVSRRRPMVTLRGFAVHGASAVFDVVTIGLGLNNWSQKLRLQTVPTPVVAAWADVLRALDQIRQPSCAA